MNCCVYLHLFHLKQNPKKLAKNPTKTTSQLPSLDHCRKYIIRPHGFFSRTFEACINLCTCGWIKYQVIQNRYPPPPPHTHWSLKKKWYHRREGNNFVCISVFTLEPSCLKPSCARDLLGSAFDSKNVQYFFYGANVFILQDQIHKATH